MGVFGVGIIFVGWFVVGEGGWCWVLKGGY